MGCRRFGVGWLSVLAGVLWASLGTAGAQEAAAPTWESAPVPLERLPAAVRESVRQTLAQPTFQARGPAECFICDPRQYHWFLEHPDRAVVVWRRLGAKCVDIQDRGNGRFGWADSLGSDVSWSTLYKDEHMRVWYAEGGVRAGSLMPLLPVRAVVVLRYAEECDQAGQSFMRHQVELLLHTDSKTAALVAKLVGASAPRLGEQYVAQLEMFYSALSWYVGQHPRQAEVLLSDVAGAPMPAAPHPALPPALSPLSPARYRLDNP
jgi:hypothetical protein